MSLNKPTIFYLLSFVILFGGNMSAQGDLMIMPKRLVFEGNERAQEINLVNTGKDSATYAISFIQYKMTEDGNFEQITIPEENQRFADPFLRYYPRRVNLGPNEAQTVRVQLTRTGNLNEGECRSHMYFRAIEEETALGVEQATESDGISIDIKTVFGISIPVIVRKGDSTTKVELTDIQLTKMEDYQQLLMTINRTGNMSVYGDLKVEFIDNKGISTEIGKVKGISVYTPNNKRHFSMNLRKPGELTLKDGKIKITYSTDSGEIMASSEIEID